MQVYALTYGLAASLFGIALVGGCNRCSCRQDTQAVCTDCTPVPQRLVAQAAPPPTATPAPPRDPGSAPRGADAAARSFLPSPRPAVALAIPEPLKSGPPRAEISFQPIEPPTPTHLPPPAATKLPTPVPAAPRDEHFAHAPDFTWLRGQVEYSHTRKEWRLRYAPLSETDTNGGHVILIENNHVNYLLDGQFVRVEGHVVTSQGGRQGSPFYRIESFKVVQ